MRQTRRDLLALFALSLAARLVIAGLIPRPGYVDASYYAAGAVNLAQGGGFSEPFIWNYLDAPTGIPHPGFLYWMPLPSILAAPFAALFPGSFFALQLPFAFLSALLPPAAYTIAWQTTQRRRLAWIAALLNVFSGFFFPYWSLPETFAPFAFFGSLALWLAGSWMLDTGRRSPGVGRWTLVGVLAGLAHLTRADGILLLPVVAFAPLVSIRPRNTQHVSRPAPHVSRSLVRHSSFVILGYLLVMGPWFLRNLSAIGTPLSSAGTKTLWLTNYDDLFCYNCSLSPRSYLAWGWDNILLSKLSASWTNLLRFLAEDCLVFLFPFVLLGIYRLRRRPTFALLLVYLFLIYSAHSLVFTFPGPRGGFFHTSGALLPFLYTAGVEGLDAAVSWAARRRRGWNRRQAQAVFTAAAVAAAMALSAYVTARKLPAWQGTDAVYQKADRWLDVHRVPADTRIVVGNPPAFWYHTGRPSVVVPNGDAETLLKVANRYDAKYVILDRNRPRSLAALHSGEVSYPQLRPSAAWAERNTTLYSVKR